MREFLQFLIKAVDKAIVIFSVSAAHYIEMEWLYNKVISIPMGNFKALGVCLGRPFPAAVTKAANNCPCLKLLKSKLHIGEYIAICEPSADWSGWKCAEVQDFCPFVRQDISKNVLEYFFSPNMELVAVEHLGDVSQVLNKFLD